MSDAVQTDDLESWEVRWTSGELEALTNPQRAISNLPTGRLPKLRATGEKSVNFRILIAIASLSGAALASRAFGVVNQVVISDRFGTTNATDAYFVTLALPILVTNLVVAAVSASTIPIYVRLTKAEQQREASEVLSTLINVVTIFLLLILALLLLFPRPALIVLAPGVSSETIDIGVTLAPYLFPTLLLNIFVGFLTSVLNATRRFGWPALAGMLWPLAILLAALFLSAQYGIVALGIGQLVGTGAQFLVTLLLTRKSQFRYRPVLRLKNPNARLALSQLWPALIGSMIGQANGVIDQVVASTLGAGDISALNYADKIAGIPVSLIFVAGAQAVLPYFSSQVAAGDFQSLKKTLNLFAWVVSIVTLITTIGFIVFADLIVDVLLRHGAFTDESAQKTAATLIGFAVGLCPMALCFMLPRVFNAMHRNQLLMRISLFTMVTNLALDIVLVRFLGLPGIALGTSIDYLLSLILQITLLRSLIGPLGLLKFPPQLRQWLSPRRRSDKRHLPPAENRRRAFTFWRVLRNGTLILLGFLASAVVTSLHPVAGVLISLGLALAVFFLRSPYLLLLAWAGLGPLYDAKIDGISMGWVLALASLPVFAITLLREWRNLARQTWAIWAYLFFLIWMLTSVIHPAGIAKLGAIEWTLTNYLALMVLTVAVLTTRERFDRFLSVLFTASTTISLIGIAEYILRFDGYQEPNGFWFYRVFGIFGWMNSFAFYLDMVLPLVLYRLLTVPRERRRFWAGILAIHLLALAFTFSREAIITAGIMAVITAILLGGRLGKWVLGGVGFALLLVAGLLLIPGLGLVNRLGDNLLTLNARTDAWNTLISHLDLQNPFGQGYYASWTLLLRIRPHNVLSPENLYLQMLFDIGIPGMVFLAAAFVLLFWGAMRKALRSQGEARVAAAVATGGIVILIIFNLTGMQFLDPALGHQFWFLAAFPYLPLFSRLPAKRKPRASAPPGPTPSVPLPDEQKEAATAPLPSFDERDADESEASSGDDETKQQDQASYK